MRVIYVAGPFRACNSWEMECNIRRAETVALDVWRAGYVALCPHLNTRFFQGTLPDETWLKGDLEMLSRCDGMVLVAGWEGSAGTIEEIKYARNYGIPVYANVRNLCNQKEWLD